MIFINNIGYTIDEKILRNEIEIQTLKWVLEITPNCYSLEDLDSIIEERLNEINDCE